MNGKFASGDDPATGTGGMQSISGVGAMPDGELYPVIMIRSVTTEANFGQKPFKFPPPDGFQPLNTANTRLETVTSRPDQFVGITTWKGNGSGRILKDFDFKIDVVWIKNRDNVSAHNHMLYDTVRGSGVDLMPNRTQQESQGGSNDMTSFNSDGFTIGSNNAVNQSDREYVAWCWKGGGPRFGGQDQ